MMKTPTTLLACLMGLSATLPLAASAHDFWMEPEAFKAAEPGPVSLDLRIGHPDDRDYWPFRPDRVLSFTSIGPDGLRDQQAVINTASAQTLDAELTEGLHVVAIQTQDSISELEADRFNEYIAKEGVTPIEVHRVKMRTTDEAGVERYSRRGKTLIAMGGWQSHPTDHATRPVGLTLELTPLQNPYALEAGETIDIEARYRGLPQPGVTVKIVRLGVEEDISQKAVTDENGLISVPKPDGGDWMFHAIWASPLPQGSDQDYDTIFSSLTITAD